jgi:hypothetical protein
MTDSRLFDCEAELIAGYLARQDRRTATDNSAHAAPANPRAKYVCGTLNKGRTIDLGPANGGHWIDVPAGCVAARACTVLTYCAYCGVATGIRETRRLMKLR